MTDRCELKLTQGIVAECDEDQCVFWRVAGHLDIATSGKGCAIQHFEILGETGSGIAEWLLSVKDRVEAQGSSGGCADDSETDIAETA